MIVLIFGATSLAERLHFYLQNYADAKGHDMLAMREDAQTMKDVQNAAWDKYVNSQAAGRPDLIINALEVDNLIECETNPAKAWARNTRLAGYIAYAARSASIPLFQMSTDHVFRGDHGPYSAGSTPRNPINVYGATKWYAEHLVQKIYPWEPWDETPKGSTIIRTSELYGFDMATAPRMFAKQDSEKRAYFEGTLARTDVFSPSFIAEVAFLIARNIIHALWDFNAQVIHVASAEPPVSWGEYLGARGAKVVLREARPYEQEVRMGPRRGLTPSHGFALSKEMKSWRDFTTEYETAQMRDNKEASYLRYWDG